MKLTVAAAMVPDIKGDKERNFAASEDLTRSLAGLGADMVILPESCLQGYPVSEPTATRESITAGAEAAEGPYPKKYRKLAGQLGIHLVACYDESRDEILQEFPNFVLPKDITDEGWWVGRVACKC